MKKKYCFSTLLILFAICILLKSSLAASYALHGLQIWYHKMIPSLLPFMILSGIMIRLNLTDHLTQYLYPVLKRIYGISKKGCYIMLVGMFCGFPMGARTIDDLYCRKEIALEEATFLLYFCNQIGPSYFCGIVLSLLNCKQPVLVLIGMYGIPLLYGFFLRKTMYRDKNFPNMSLQADTAIKCTSFQIALDSAVHDSVFAILQLGGYMVIFNECNLLPSVLLGQYAKYLSVFIEISGGLALLKTEVPLLSLTAVSFGGLCCMAQTYTSLQNSGLNRFFGQYAFHKTAQSIFVLLYYRLLLSIGCL